MDKRNLMKPTIKKYCLVVDEWFNNKFNGKQAYLKYYPNVKDSTATINFSKIQVLPEIAEYIKEKQEDAAKIIKTTHEGILRELNNYVELDITQTLELSLEEIRELPIEVRRSITRIKTTSRNVYNSKGMVIETIKTYEPYFVDKLRAMIEIAKHRGFYEVDNKQKAQVINITTTNDKHKGIVENILNGE